MKQRTQRVDERLMQALNLFKDADSVELKLTVPDDDRSSAITALDMDVLRCRGATGRLLRHSRPQAEPDRHSPAVATHPQRR